MSYVLKLAAYVFLALMGLSAWNTYDGGWRYYFGIVLFVICVLRILMLLRQGIPGTRGVKQRPAQTPDTTGHDLNPPE